MEPTYANLRPEPGLDNLGGLACYWYTAARNLVGFPERGPLTLETLTLAPGACWYRLAPTRGTADYDQKPKQNGRHGETFTQLLKGALPRHTPGLAEALERLQGGRFVVLYRDLNEQVQLVGTPAFPLEWQDTYTAGSQTSRNGFAFQFAGETLRRARPYLGSWLVADGELTYEEPGTGGPLPGGGGGTGGGSGTNRLLTFTATTTLGGVSAGEQVTVVDDETGQTAQDMLAPDQPAQAALQASGPVRQFGAPTGVTLSYSVTEGTHPITSVVVNGQAQTYADGSPRLDGTVSASTPPNSDATFALVATDASGATVSASATVRYQHRRYWGGMVQDPFSLSDVQLSAVLRTLSQEFSAGRNQDFSLSLSDQFVVVARPAAQGTGSYVVNGLANNAFQSRTFSFTNSDGFTESFVVERSASPDTGSFNLSIR